MKKINVLMIGMSPNLGGIETYIYNAVMQLNKYVNFNLLLSDDYSIPYEDELTKIGCKIIKITSRKKNYIKHIKELKEVFNEKYDVIHYSIMGYSWFEPILLSYKKNKLIVHSHNAGFKNATFKTKILHFIGGLFVKKKKYLRIACGVDAGKFMFGNKEFFVMNNGINVEKFTFNKNNRNEIRNELKINDNFTVLGLVARLEEQKNIPFLVEIFKEYHLINKNSCLVIVGEGSLRDKILIKAKEYNIEKNIFLVGKRYDAFKFYSCFDILVMPSLYEGLSITLIEAQVNGLKCYTSNGVDINSNITGNVTFLSLDKSAKEWANIIYENNKRDENVLEKIPDSFNSKKSYENLYQYYINNIE